METKTCSKCNIRKPMVEFFKSGQRSPGKPRYRADCKSCAQKDTAGWRARNRSEYNNYVAAWRARNPDRQHKMEIKRRYGLSMERYNEMLAAQNLQCKICEKQHDPTVNRGRLYVDHCHKTGSVRGLLCGACNFAIGHFSDRIDLLEKAIKYLSL